MEKSTILLIDDNDSQRVTLQGILRRSGYEVTGVDCGKAAIDIVEKQRFSIALLDIKLPDMTGIDVLKVLKKSNEDMPVVMMTGSLDLEYAVGALNAGATSYLLKPLDIEIVKNTVRHAIDHARLVEENKKMAEALREWAAELENRVEVRTAELAEARHTAMTLFEEMKRNFESTLNILSIAIDQRDSLTASHSFRVTEYATEIGKIMGLTSHDNQKIRYAGLMHDLGKIQIDKTILCKEGSLTLEEYQEIQTHVTKTFDLLSMFKFQEDLQDVPLLAASHHERYDGSGYPAHLKADQIPLGSRILAVADVLDAITSKRHYRTAMSINNALEILKRDSGTHFDPNCVDAAFQMDVATFVKIHMAERLSHLHAEDILAFKDQTLNGLLEAASQQNPTDEQKQLIQRFYRYYRGDLPAHLVGKIDLPANRDMGNDEKPVKKAA